MDRRTFIGSFALATLAAPGIVLAQPIRKGYRIGILGLSPTTSDMAGPQPRNRFTRALLEGFRDLGYVHGEHFVTEPRGAEGKVERFPDLVADLLGLQVDVIVAVAASTPALKQATSTMPIVMAGHGDPVGQGYAESLARPGRNFTGLTFQSRELVAKRLELLRELVPATARVAVIWDRPSYSSWQAADAAARDRGWQLLSFEIREVGEVEGALKAASSAGARAVLISAGSVLDPHWRRVAELVLKSRLPSMHHFKFYVEAGALMSYAPDLLAIWRRAALFVDKILKGAKPGEVPIEQPTKFELTINAKTAKAFGLTIPHSLLLRADQVIE